MPIKIHARVHTPNGPGIIQGNMVKRNLDGSYESLGILVSHRPQDVPPEMLPLMGYRNGIWVLWCYKLDDLEIIE